MSIENHRSALAMLLAAKIGEASISQSKLSEILGISKSYVSQLLSGEKQTRHINIETLRAIAAYLKLPVIDCLVLAEVLKQKDFMPGQKDETLTIERALNFVAMSTMAQTIGVTKNELYKIPENAKVLIIKLFETGFDVRLLPTPNNCSYQNSEIPRFTVKENRAK
ncbi:helix-turn-helix domain-containing protein [Azonexus hydrophilus]|uniref:helix-turn-helix domain-containing protein n=1 Tax=Azonexus hydrophilus TaxID=418702 RepID=UPI0009E01E43|nr:helix-turn-helix transcriptional regulator [Azonexus hydrophilus]